MSEAVEAKACRYLAEGRIRVLSVSLERVEATARSDTGKVYRVVREAGEGTSCNCPAYGKRCCHRLAVESVT